ncbi:antibiotic ABC transporter ATP-binding protein [Streptomyces sp. NPDC005498]|uniref:antibiotic ABC transporter ATP-binding protein n=1 Tax=Streptomyces sp. NPDC005498 TaxID=3364717 RepID=UPI0036B6DC3A
MAKIVVVHGVGQEFLGPAQMHRDLVPALQDGVRLAGGPLLEPSDVVCAFYGDLYFKEGTRSTDLPPWDETDVQNGVEEELLMAWWEHAARVDPDVPSPDEAHTRGLIGFGASRLLRFEKVRAALDALAGSRFFSKVSDRSLIFALKQVRRYLTEQDLRLASRARLADEVRDDTRVLVAHSLGSVVAYEALCAHPEWPVTDLVTLGSPLGLQGVVFNRLQPTPTNGVGAWPGRVQHWTNIADPSDIVAVVNRLSFRFGERVRDEQIENGIQMHDLVRYLSAPKTGAAVARSVQ